MFNEIINIDFNNSKNEYSFEIMTLQSLFQRNLEHLLTVPQRLGFYLIIVYTKGSGKHSIDFNEYVYTEGTVLTISKNQVQKYFIDEKSEGFQILFTENFIIKYYDEKQIFNSQLIFNDALNSPKIQLEEKQFTEIIDICHQLYNEFYNQADDHFKDPILRSKLHVLLLKLERFKQQLSTKPIDENLAEFFRFKNLIDSKCLTTRNVNDYCNELNTNYKKLNSVTKSIVNKTAKEFIDERLILEVKRLLANTSLPIKEIAYRAGFDEPTNLIKYFKNLTKQSPSDFRNTI